MPTLAVEIAEKCHQLINKLAEMYIINVYISYSLLVHRCHLGEGGGGQSCGPEGAQAPFFFNHNVAL